MSKFTEKVATRRPTFDLHTIEKALHLFKEDLSLAFIQQVNLLISKKSSI